MRADARNNLARLTGRILLTDTVPAELGRDKTNGRDDGDFARNYCSVFRLRTRQLWHLLLGAPLTTAKQRCLPTPTILEHFTPPFFRVQFSVAVAHFFGHVFSRGRDHLVEARNRPDVRNGASLAGVNSRLSSDRSAICNLMPSLEFETLIQTCNRSQAI